MVVDEVTIWPLVLGGGTVEVVGVGTEDVGRGFGTGGTGTLGFGFGWATCVVGGVTVVHSGFGVGGFLFPLPNKVGIFILIKGWRLVGWAVWDGLQGSSDAFWPPARDMPNVPNGDLSIVRVVVWSFFPKIKPAENIRKPSSEEVRWEEKNPICKEQEKKKFYL